MHVSRSLFVALAMVAGMCASSAAAQIRYGPWVKDARSCRPARSTSGFGSVQLPQAPGGERAQSCRWYRNVEECPRIRDRLRHPIQCSRREQSADGDQNRPSVNR